MPEKIPPAPNPFVPGTTGGAKLESFIGGAPGIVVASRVDFPGAVDGHKSDPGSGTIFFNLATKKLQSSEDGSGFVDLVGGASTSASTVTATVVALDTLNAYKPATITGRLADSSNTAYYGKVIGITTSAIAIGFAGDVVVDGLVTNGAWSWTPGATIFLNGTSLSQTSPSTGFSQEMGIAKSSDTIYVDVSTPILL